MILILCQRKEKQITKKAKCTESKQPGRSSKNHLHNGTFTNDSHPVGNLNEVIQLSVVKSAKDYIFFLRHAPGTQLVSNAFINTH